MELVYSNTFYQLSDIEYSLINAGTFWSDFLSGIALSYGAYFCGVLIGFTATALAGMIVGGVLLVGGLAFGGYCVYQLYQHYN